MSVMKKVDTFASLGLSRWLCNVLENLDISEPTPIQKMCIPETLKGKIVIGMSETGSGKTAAFVLPILDQLVRDLYGPFALIVAPTRELAFQIEKAIHSFAGNFTVRTALLIGGVSLTRQAQLLDTHPHFVVGTPGRLEELIRMYPESRYFKRVRYLVFDEADRILNVKFSLDIGVILDACSPHRQTLLYSATMNAHVKKLAKLAIGKDKATRDRVFVCDATQLYRPVKKLKQYYLFVPAFVKECYLYAFLRSKIEMKKHATGIVFMQKMKDCELICRTMKGMGISTVSLHSTKHQRDRLEALEVFRKREARVLVCTDVAARGLDIPDVRYVLNYDIPETTEDYIHRVGRTARQGQSGIALSLVSPDEVSRVHLIESQMKVKLQSYQGLGRKSFNNTEEEEEEEEQGGSKKSKKRVQSTRMDQRIEKEIEEKVYEIAEQRCRAKIKMLEDGFYEQYQKRRDIIQKGKKLEKNIRSYFKKKRLFSSTKSSSLENNRSSSSSSSSSMLPLNDGLVVPNPDSVQNNQLNIGSNDNASQNSNMKSSNEPGKRKRKKKKKKKKKQSESGGGGNIQVGGMTLLKKRKRKHKNSAQKKWKQNKHKKRKI